MGSESTKSVKVSKKSSSLSTEKLFPPGFRFHPTDEELVLYYLKRKICGRPVRLDVIGEVDVYKWDPEELPDLSKLKTGDKQWFFFSPRDRKYPNGGRSSRATMHGYWKATGKDRAIRAAGIKKTLVYYEGRAPTGQRTDWVMHEYTLTVEELKRCQSAQEYYALYKVYKKSGPGPKNGEQYGAPFVEEEWTDDHYLEVDALFVQKVNPEKQVPFLPVNNTKIVSEEEKPLSTNDVLEILNKIVDEHEMIPPQAQIDCVTVAEEMQNCLLEYSTSKVDQRNVMVPCYEHCDVQPRSDLAQSAYEASEVTEVTNVHIENPPPLVVNEDFLEMDDLIGPQPVIQNSEIVALENLQFADFDGMAEFDMFPAGFCNEMCNEMLPFESQQILQPYYLNNLEYGVENSGFHSNSNDTCSEVVNYQQLHDENQSSYSLWTHDQGNSNFPAMQATHEAISDLWTDDQGNSHYTAARATDEAISPSGVIIDEKRGKPDSHVNQRPKTKEDDGTDSWFASALWAFVESIPTTPASASESSALVNRAFERMSSFSGRGRAVNEAAAAGVNSTLASRRLGRSSRSSRGIIYFSVLGVLFAMLWVFVGTSIEFLQRCIS